MNPYPSEQTLFIHDAGGGSWEWCVWKDVFEQHDFETYTINLEPSEQGSKNTSSSDYIEQLFEYVDKHKLENPIIVGAGMGAMLALKAYRQINPSALVLINPLGSEAFNRPLDEIDFTSVIFNKPQSTEESTPSKKPSTNENGTNRTGDSTSLPTLQRLLDESAIPEIFCPCQLLIGEQMEVVPPETGNELAARLNAEVISFEGKSHIDALLGIEAKAIARHLCQNLLSL